MYLRRTYLREGKSMTLTSTYKEDLPDNGYLTAILLTLSGAQASGYGQDGGDWRIIDKISKIEIIANGSKIIKSLRGDALQAIAQCDQKVTAPDQWQNYATNTQWCVIPIYFGRSFIDNEIFLDLAKYDSVEIQITNTATSSHFSGLAVSILGTYLEPVAAVAAPIGYMRTEEWKEYTTVQDATEYFDLPTEHAIRRLLLQIVPNVDSDNVEKTAMWNLADDIGLYLKSGNIEVYRGGIDDLMRASCYENGAHVLTSGHTYMNADKGINMGVGYVDGVAGIAGAQDGAVAAGVPTIEGKRTSFTQKPEAYEADTLVELMVKGLCYHNVLPIRFDLSDNPLDWLDPDAQKTVQLKIHTRNISDAADGKVRINLDRFVRY